MSYLHKEPTRTVGRPRDHRREAEILRVVLSCLAEVGYDRLGFELVAQRASASKPTLYRRWTTKREMVLAAVRSLPAPNRAEVPDTGTLRGDLLVLCGLLADTLSSTDQQLVAALLQAGLADPELCDFLESTAGPTGARLPEEVLQHAVVRRELPADASSFAYDEVVGSVLVLRALNGLPFGPGFCEQLVDAVVVPALRAAAPASDFPGIFAGTHTPTTGDS